jgi:hypothetical protein
MNSDGDYDDDYVRSENDAPSSGEEEEEEEAVVRPEGSEEESVVVEAVVDKSAPGLVANTDDEDTNQGKKPTAITRKATPPSSPAKSGKATTPTSLSRSTPPRNRRLPDRFPYIPASTGTPEGKKDSSAGSKRKATPGAASKKKGRAGATVVQGKKTATGGVVFLKDAEREGLTRPK